MDYWLKGGEYTCLFRGRLYIYISVYIYIDVCICTWVWVGSGWGGVAFWESLEMLDSTEVRKGG